MDIRSLNDLPAFITKDGSEIRELLAYRNSAIRHQSLAEARCEDQEELEAYPLLQERDAAISALTTFSNSLNEAMYT